MPPDMGHPLAVAGSGQETSRDTGGHDRARLRTSTNVGEDDAASEAYNPLLAGHNASTHRPETRER